MMNIIPVNYNSDRITVLGRDLHAALEIKSDYSHWFKRMIEYGFEENTDYVQFSEPLKADEKDENESSQEFVPINRPKTNHQLTLDMAKEIAMIQRTPIGKQVRKYFIEVEKQYRQTNKPVTRFPETEDETNHLLLIAGQRAEILEHYFQVNSGIAKAHALSKVEQQYQVDLSDIKKLLPATTEPIDYLNPTMIAQQLTAKLGEKYTANGVNTVLAEMEFQYKADGWMLTEDGKQYGSMYPYERNGHTGYQIRWKQSVVPAILNWLK